MCVWTLLKIPDCKHLIHVTINVPVLMDMVSETMGNVGAVVGNGFSIEQYQHASKIRQTIAQSPPVKPKSPSVIFGQPHHDDFRAKFAGAVGATAFLSEVNAGHFTNGRQLSASCGLVPWQHSLGRKNILSSMTKSRNRGLRTLIIHSARSVMHWARYMAETPYRVKRLNESHNCAGQYTNTYRLAITGRINNSLYRKGFILGLTIAVPEEQRSSWVYRFWWENGKLTLQQP